MAGNSPAASARRSATPLDRLRGAASEGREHVGKGDVHGTTNRYNSLTVALAVIFCVVGAAPCADVADSCSFLDHPGDVDVICVFHAPTGYSFEAAQVWYCNPAQSCTSVDAQIWVNGQFAGQTGWVAPGAESPHFDVTSFVTDTDSVVVALHDPRCPVGNGCCTTGMVQTWGGSINIRGEVTAATASVDPALRPAQTWGLIKALWSE